MQTRQVMRVRANRSVRRLVKIIYINNGSVQNFRRARASLRFALRVYQAHRPRSERPSPLRLRSRTMALGESHDSRWRRDDARVFHRVVAVREWALRFLSESRAGWIHVELSLQSR